MTIIENNIEKYLLKEAKRKDILCYKFTSPGNNGVPDRIMIGNGQVIFVELKRPGAKPRELQQVIIRRMRERGADVRLVDTKKGVNLLIKEMISK